DVADCIDSERCNTGVVSPGQGDIEIVTENENGATMARLLIPEGAIPGGFLVTLDCRSGGYDPGDGPLPTGLTQWPLFCHVTATDPDGEPFEVELDGDATMDICVVDEEISGQDPWHDFPDHEDLLLGKSDGPFSFELLPFAPSTLGCEGNTTPLPEEAGLGSRILRELDTRLAPAFGVLLPEGLRAAPMYFRDGGVGGLLRSFSDINPVEPAFISGTVSDGESELEGVTVTLSESFGCEGEFCEYGEGDEDVLASVETDENGLYEFGPLDTGDYVVTVECPFEYYLDDFVEVEGSGTTTVDITCELPGE
ncbi:MAG: carboxypeptidase regulatory-like domain-containing protein, partial [Gemmatimonadetes bacterium]|nr:carboxypeptidase regulatory-like domain-containing protein [Gemmatimonadota bacterium]